MALGALEVEIRQFKRNFFLMNFRKKFLLTSSSFRDLHRGWLKIVLRIVQETEIP